MAIPDRLSPPPAEDSSGSEIAWSNGASAERTVVPVGHRLDEFFRPQFVLQLLDAAGKWRDYAPIYPKGRTVGSKLVATLAPRHFGLGFAKNRLCVQEIDSLNGVYVRITQAARIESGARFRIGDYLLEFRAAERHEEVRPQRSEYGEKLCSRDITLLGWIVLIRPDGQPGASFPMTAPTVILGRAPTIESGTAQAFVLPDEGYTISRTHARLYIQDGHFFLKDQGTGLGTYLRIQGACPLNPGDEFLAADVRFRVEMRSGG